MKFNIFFNLIISMNLSYILERYKFVQVFSTERFNLPTINI